MSSRLALGLTQPPIQWVLGALSPGVQQLGHEVDHSPPTSAEVKKIWSLQLIPKFIHNNISNPSTIITIDARSKVAGKTTV
jgi:hypothetical protein